MMGFQVRALLTTTALVTAVPALAQTGPSALAPVVADASAEQPDIVVTALKRPERVQNVPVSINVVQPDTLANVGATKLEDLQRISPSVSFTPSSGQIHSTISMRGVFSNNLAPGIPAAVGIVVDDIAQPPEAQGFNELVDIERVEVLRGPQSTISGRNASAGLINIVTRAPTDHLTAQFDATATTDREYRTQAYISGPIGSTLSASASGYYSNFRGIAFNTVLKDYYGRETYGGRVKLRFKPSDRFEATLTGFLQHLNDESAAPITQSFSPGANRLGLTFPGVAGGFNFDGTNKYIASPVRGYQRSDSRAVSFRMALDVGDNQLLSISGYQHEKIDQVQDVLGVIQAAINLTAGFSGAQLASLPTETKSQEFRFVSSAAKPFSFILGAYYLDTTATYSFARAGLAPFSRVRDNELKNYAAYVRVNWKPVDHVSLIGGLRLNREEISYNLVDRLAAINNSSGSDSDNVVLGDASVQYEFRRDLMVYARYARGYQGKAFDTDAPVNRANPAAPVSAANSALPYVALAPEHVDAFEIGLKSQFLDRRITINIALYDATYRGYQTQTRVDDGAGFFNFRLFSAGDVRTRGIEAELSAKVSDYFQLGMAMAYGEAKFRNFTSAPCYGGQTAAQGCVGGVQNLSGRTLGGTPKLRANGFAEYRLPIESFNASLRADVAWQDKVNFDVLGDPRTVQPDYAILNLSTSFSDRSDKYKITFFVNNVTNKQYLQQLSDNTTSFNFGAPAGTVNHVISTRYLPRDYQRYGGVRLTIKY